ncbi:MAG: MarR family transcriptional regulator [Bacteroidia bacterium]|jgi:DNA-binding MarR family transcriptional regulator
MKLEEELKQRKFSSEYEKLFVNVLFTAGYFESLAIQRFKPFNISIQQYNVLRILRGSNPTPLMLSDISSRMIDKNSNATRLVEKLRVKGLVKREICNNNRRQVDISITQKGLDLLTEIEVNAEDFHSQLKVLTIDEATALNEYLDRLRG